MAAEGALLQDQQKHSINPKDVAQSQEVDSRKFLLKFGNSKETFEIYSDGSQTVLQAIKSKTEIREKIKCDEDKIVLCIGKQVPQAIPTHFPCALLQEEELVTLTQEKKRVENTDGVKWEYSVSKDQHYFVVFIETEGGKDTKTKPLFVSKQAMKKFSQLCVYGTEGMTLADAIERDGRFVELRDFKLQHGTNEEKVFTLKSDEISLHDGKTFRISIKRKSLKRAVAEDRSEQPPAKVSRAAVQETSEAAGGSGEHSHFYKRLCEFYPDLDEESLRKYFHDLIRENELKKVDFAKAQQTFSDLYRMEKLCDLAKSICMITSQSGPLGTGFVVFQHYVLTCAHLFKNVLYQGSVQPDINITAVFGHKAPDQTTTNFKLSNAFIDYDTETDYAILELVVRAEDESLVPPGLMRRCCPMPPSGEACLIGHPGGAAPKHDPTCIIEKQHRKREVEKQLQRFDDTTIPLARHVTHSQGIESILSPSQPEYNNVASYNTYMSFGSSGSPVFEYHCRVFAMHSAGFIYDNVSVIEIARPLLLIFKKFVTKLKATNNTALLTAVEEELRENPYKGEILSGEEAMNES